MKYSKIILLAAVILTLLLPTRAQAQMHVPVTAGMDVSCPQEGGSFQLTAVGGAPHAQSDTISVTGSGTGRFTCTFPEPGDYVYELSQIHMDLSGISYDKSKYTVLFHVTTDENGMLSCSTVLTKKGTKDKYKAVVYTNTRRTNRTNTGQQGTETVRESAGTRISSPKTGDSAPEHIAFLAAGMAGCLAALRILVRKGGDKR